ncbi:hypothetical protein P7C73_g6252, partial [Tremellales sp. Uapishka_1]
PITQPPSSNGRSSKSQGRRVSQVSTTSDSTTNSATPTKRSDLQKRLGPALGIDGESSASRVWAAWREAHAGFLAELAAEAAAAQPQAHKRHFNFRRAPGTASSPDLATLVKKAKEARAMGKEPSPAAQAAEAQVAARSASTRATPSRPSSSSVPQSQSSTSQASSSPTKSGRDRAATHGTMHRQKQGDDEVDLQSMGSGDRMATIAEGRGTRSRQSSTEESFKSAPSTPTAPSWQPSSPSERPPVPPLPMNYSAEADARKRALTPNLHSNDMFSPTPPMGSPKSHEPPVEEGRPSSTPTGSRRVSTGSNLSLEKPLPAMIPEGEGPPRPSNPSRISMHVRQPAGDTIIENDTADATPNPSPNPPDISSFSDDVSGMLDCIGHSEPARELGLPPENVRINSARSVSADTARSPLYARFPAELARTKSVEGVVPVVLIAPQIPTKRTSSLPDPHRLLPSPQDRIGRTSSPRLSSDNVMRLDPPVRTSSRSPEPTTRTSNTSPDEPTTPTKEILPAPSLAPVAPGSPLNVGTEFGMKPVSGQSPDATVRAGQKHSPLLPQSMRLVASPRLEQDSALDLTSESLMRSPFASSSPWGRQAVQLEDPVDIVIAPTASPIVEREAEDDEEKGRRLACEILEGDFTNVSSEKVAEFLGGPRPVNNSALRYYMQYFDMRAQSLDQAFRDLCQKLYLKAESQEIDRIIEAFSSRFYECNPSTVFGTPDLSKHMSKADFVRNAMRAIQESMPSTDRSSTPDLVRDDSSSLRVGFGSNPSMAVPSSSSVRAKPLARPEMNGTQRSASAPLVLSSPSLAGSELDRKARESSTTVSSFSYTKAWESDAETALKEIFTNVRADRILLPIGGRPLANGNRNSTISLGGGGPYGVHRRSTLRSPSQQSDRVNALKRGSIRGMTGLMGNNPYNSTFAASDGRLSPTPSYATSIEVGCSLGIELMQDEARSVHSQMSTETFDELTEDELALVGAPWAKEGLLSRKTYQDTPNNKRTLKKDWKQFFVVIQKGELHAFTFGDGKNSSFGGGAMGGGNWLTNATAAGGINLMHAMATSLPSGYSPSRPHVWNLTLPTGECSFFQAGTDELVAEWVATCNYWAARKSRQPLQGGVSNMEYGWTRALPDGPTEDQDDKASVRSGRSGMSKLGGTYGRKTLSSNPVEKMHINDWKPPPAATIPSPLDEESQLESLQAYVKTLLDELEGHKNVEKPMKNLYASRSPNGLKAKENWTAKSKYIHSEIFKYETYIDALQSAITLRVKKQGEKRLEKSLARSMTSLHQSEEDEEEDELAGLGSRRKTGKLSVNVGRDEGEEEEEPNTPSAATFQH